MNKNLKKNITLNFHDLSKSDIKFKLNRFPDGEVQITELEVEKLAENMNFIMPIRNAEELFIFVQMMELIHTSIHRTNVIIPYLMGARNDRSMAPGRGVTLFDVLWVISNSLYPLDRLTFITMHNEEAVSKWFADAEPWLGEEFDSENLDNPRINFIMPYPNFKTNENEMVVFPDKGAERRFKHLVDGPYLVAEKVRDVNQAQSRILKYELLNPMNYDLKKIKKISVLDDLVDGGNTFKLLSSALHTELNNNSEFSVELYLTHFIQEEGLLSLTEYYDIIYVCDTFRPVPPNINIHKLKEIEDMI